MAELGGPRPTLGVRHAVALCVGIVVGAGIFRTPSMVAEAAGDPVSFLLVWLAGGVLSIVGALCYAELAAAWPSAGGDYHFLERAFGPRVGFLYAWARLSVIQTGSLALLAFVFGDYAATLVDLGPTGPALFAGAVVIALTALNWIGIRAGAGAQAWLTTLEVGGVLAVALAGLWFAPVEPDLTQTSDGGAIGLAMVFVLLTFGGWSEAVYVSAELRNARRRIASVLVASVVLVTLLYLLVNWAYVSALGMAGLAQADAPAAELMQIAFGPTGAVAISMIVALAALTSANATAITGARTAWALGRSVPALGWLGRWHGGRNTPANALLAQGAIALLLVIGGGFARDGFRVAVEYTAPVFWLFFFLVGVALFVLRRREPQADRPFRVPLYPLTPLIFCATSLFLLYSSLAYTGAGALFGVGVLALGGVLLLFFRPSSLPKESAS